MSTPPLASFDAVEITENDILEENLEENLPSMGYINDRIFEYGRKLDRWKDLDGRSLTVKLGEDDAALMVRCFRRLQNVLNGYTDLKTRMLLAEKVTIAERIGSSEIFAVQKNDIDFIENECGRLLDNPEDQSVGWTQREEGADLAQLETLIDRYAGNHEYEQVVGVWGQIPEFQVPRVQLRTKILYGNALMYLNQEEKASRIYSQVVEQMSDSEAQATDLVSLRKVLADLYTASGNYEDAKVQYKKISEDYQNLGRHEEWSKLQLSILDRSMEGTPELNEYSSVLRNYLGYIPDQDGYRVVWQAEEFLTAYPYSPVASNVDFIKESVSRRADKWFERFLTQVDTFRKDKKFKEALELLETMPTSIISPEKQIRLKEKNDELLLAEAVETETEKMARLQDLQHQWNNGMVLAREEKFDEAIAVFTNLLDTEYGVKADNQIQLIVRDAAKADRREAADLFTRYRKTTDLESKKRLLIECRRLLKNILAKYPEVDIAQKVIGNIARVEQEMNALDPMLILQADQDVLPAGRSDGAERAFSGTSLEAGGVPVMNSGQ